MVQFRMRRRATPTSRVYAQHRWAERRPWDEVEKLEGRPDTPVVYVARGSHASYFRPGYHETEAWYDIADGKRRPRSSTSSCRRREAGWTAWPGRWGDTRPRYRGSTSRARRSLPHEQWDHPGAPARREDGAAGGGRAGAAGRGLAGGRPPRLAYDFSDRKGAMPDRLVVTVNSEDDSVQPRTFTFPLQGERKGAIETEIELKPAQRYDIYVSAVDADGRPTESALTLLGPVGSERPEKSWALSAFARVVAWFRRRFGAS